MWGYFYGIFILEKLGQNINMDEREFGRF